MGRDGQRRDGRPRARAGAAGKSVLVVTGDGEMLMGFGALATIALQKPANLSIAVLDNGHFGETGMQVSHAGRGIDLDRVAATCGFSWTARSATSRRRRLRSRLGARDGTKLATIKVKAGEPAAVLPPRDGVYVKNRFRAALGHAPI